MANTGYTRNITFTVNDKQIKRATDRLFQSLDRIEKKLDLIGGKGNKGGFKRLELGVDKSTKKVNLLSAAVNKTKQTFSTFETTLRTFAGTVNVLNNVRLGYKGAIVEALTFNNLLRDQSVLLRKMGRAAPGSPYMRNAMAGGDPLDPRGGTHPYRYFNEQGTLGGLNYVGKRRRGAWQEDLRRRMGIRRQALERSGTGFGAFSRDVDFHQAFRASRGMNYGGMTSGQTAVDKSIKRHEKHLAKINKATNKTASILAKQAVHPALPPGVGTQYDSPIGPRPATFGQRAGQWGNRLGFGKNANRQGVFANSRGMQGRVGGALQSGMIGGGFPLLFGQSPAAAAAGGLGGVLGGALSPGFGFAGSIVATAVAQKIQEAIDFRKAIDELNVSIKATGGTSVFTAAQVTKFAKSLGMTKDEALNALAAFKQFEASARIALTTVFGSEAIFNMAAGFKDNAYLIGRMNELSQVTSLEQAKTALEVLKTKGLREAEVATLELLIKKQKELTTEQTKKGSITWWDKLNPFRGMVEFGAKRKDGRIGAMDVEELREARTDKYTQEDFPRLLAEAKERLELQQQWNDELERMAIIKAPEDELRKLLDPLRQIDSLSKSIGSSFSESFKGIVKGSTTAKEALANLFQRTADHFLDMTAQIIAAQIRGQFLGMFKGVFGGGPSPTDWSTWDAGGYKFKETKGSSISFGDAVGGKRAGGGPVSGGTSYLVGEKGPEIFTPRASGNITANDKIGGTNIVVNVDASGSSVEGDEDQGRMLGRMIAAAIQSELIKQKRSGGILA